MTRRVPLPAAQPSRDGNPVRHESSTYAELIHVATELFGELGYERTTVREISKRMGMQSGSLYSHISSKDELLEEIIRRVGSEFIARAQEAVARCDDPEQKLRELIAQHIQVMHNYLPAVAVYFNEWTKLDEASRRSIVKLRREYEQIFAHVIRSGISQGKFRKVDVTVAVVWILSALNWTYQWYTPGGSQSPRKLSEAYADLLLSGLNAVTRSSQPL